MHRQADTITRHDPPVNVQEEVAELTSLDDIIDADVSCNMHDTSLMQLERDWIETTRKLKQEKGKAMHADAKVNNFLSSTDAAD
jgi:hypothetical protein